MCFQFPNNYQCSDDNYMYINCSKDRELEAFQLSRVFVSSFLNHPSFLACAPLQSYLPIQTFYFFLELVCASFYTVLSDPSRALRIVAYFVSVVCCLILLFRQTIVSRPLNLVIPYSVALYTFLLSSGSRIQLIAFYRCIIHNLQVMLLFIDCSIIYLYLIYKQWG